MFTIDLERCRLVARSAVTAGNYAGWSTDLDLHELGGWESGTWHHLTAATDYTITAVPGVVEYR